MIGNADQYVQTMMRKRSVQAMESVIGYARKIIY